MTKCDLSILLVRPLRSGEEPNRFWLADDKFCEQVDKVDHLLEWLPVPKVGLCDDLHEI